MSSKYLIILLALSTIVFGNSAWAEEREMAFVGNYNSANPAQSGNSAPTSQSAGQGYGFGLMLTRPLSQNIYLEDGFHYISENYTTTNASGQSTQWNYGVIEAPVLLRYFPNPYFSVGLGVALDWAPWSIQSTSSSGATSGGSMNQNGLQNLSGTGVLSIGFRAPLTKDFGFVVDGRYRRGFTNMALSSGSGFYTNDVTVFAGITIRYDNPRGK